MAICLRGAGTADCATHGRPPPCPRLGGWLTTIVVRVCLNMLRSRKVRRERSVGVHLPDPIISRAEHGPDPEQEPLLAESVGLALQVVLDTLAPAERLAFALHDMFDLPFDDIAPMVGRTPAAARQLASRAWRRVLGSDGGALRPDALAVVRGVAAVAGRAVTFTRPGALVRPALVNGAAGVVVTAEGRPVSVMGFTVTNGKIVEIHSWLDPERLGRLDLTIAERD